MNDETLLIHLNEERSKHSGPVIPPIYQNSLFTFSKWDDIDKAFDDPANSQVYTRGNNPSVNLVEDKIAKLCGGEKAKMFSSGMGAISSAILNCVKVNDHIITVEGIYGPANNFISKYLYEKSNINSTFVDGTNINNFKNAITDNTSLIYLESPTSATFKLQNIEAICELAAEHNIKVIIDNTWATPLFQKPLKYGVDIEVHSCSKYISGHSDVIAGVVIGKEEIIDSITLNESALLGATMSPIESSLILRSLRTLPLRVKGHQENTSKIIDFLKESPKIKEIFHPIVNQQNDLYQKQMTGFTGLLSLELATTNLDEIKNFVNSLQYFKLGVSWGGFESLVYAPAISYLKELTTDQFKSMGISLGTIRLSIGLENSDDLITDLEQALDDLKG